MKLICTLSFPHQLTEGRIYYGQPIWVPFSNPPPPCGPNCGLRIAVCDDNGNWSTFETGYFKPLCWMLLPAAHQ